MKNSLYFKFIKGYILFGLIGFVTIATFSSKLTYSYLVNLNAKNLYDEAVVIANTYESSISSTDALERSIPYQLNIVGKFINSNIWIVDDTGKIILDSNNGKFNQHLIENFDPASGTDNYTIGNYYNMFNADMLSVSAPIIYKYSPAGYIVIHMPMSEVTGSTNDFLNIVYLTAAIIFLLSLILLIVFTNSVYKPLKTITYGAKEYAAGNLKHEIKIKSSHMDEMGYLAVTLNYMSSELANMEEYQKNFIANVSHDFRSPLTSIKGYLTAILDGTIPPEMQEKYIQRVISETERLNKLTEGMITLNSLNSKGLLNKSNFDINRTIKDVCASNENICTKKNISFELTFAAETEMVFADYGKIQQVLYNLIDNAIKFSKNNSTIYISTSMRQKKVFISVKDTGCGIPKDSIKKIWDRFYKSDSSRGKDKKGTGLGLSIVKEIISAHNEHIDVISTENVGTEFIFSLPSAEL
ncbi:MAG: HAMP domain-containing sensor histidine kinase [Eubacteriales bacterium]|nr:HAMP domain-containing sensor histidine kinase [Eubacteriales bacterium]